MHLLSEPALSPPCPRRGCTPVVLTETPLSERRDCLLPATEFGSSRVGPVSALKPSRWRTSSHPCPGHQFFRGPHALGPGGEQGDPTQALRTAHDLQSSPEASSCLPWGQGCRLKLRSVPGLSPPNIGSDSLPPKSKLPAQGIAGRSVT